MKRSNASSASAEQVAFDHGYIEGWNAAIAMAIRRCREQAHMKQRAAIGARQAHQPLPAGRLAVAAEACCDVALCISSLAPPAAALPRYKAPLAAAPAAGVPNPADATNGLRQRLLRAAVGACTCGAKAPALATHAESCHYRLFEEARAALLPGAAP